MFTPVMAGQLESQLQRWIDARIIDVSTADRIRSFERGNNAKKGHPRPIRLGIKKPEGQIMPLPVS